MISGAREATDTGCGVVSGPTFSARTTCVSRATPRKNRGMSPRRSRPAPRASRLLRARRPKAGKCPPSQKLRVVLSQRHSAQVGKAALDTYITYTQRGEVRGPGAVYPISRMRTGNVHTPHPTPHATETTRTETCSVRHARARHRQAQAAQDHCCLQEPGPRTDRGHGAEP